MKDRGQDPRRAGPAPRSLADAAANAPEGKGRSLGGPITALAAVILAVPLWVLLGGSPASLMNRDPMRSGNPVTSGESGETEEWTETFDMGRLDPACWVAIECGDFRERDVDVFDVGARRSPHVEDLRLRLRADTRGTRPETVKHLGIRSLQAIPSGEETRVSVDVDWNDQANGCYLSAGVVLSAEAESLNPLAGTDWLHVAYVGVPPGRNARLAVSARRNGQLRVLHSEGWPESNRTGRRISLQHLEIVTGLGLFQVIENGQLVYESDEAPISAADSYLYLQISSHSNYPGREIYFDNVRVATRLRIGRT